MTLINTIAQSWGWTGLNPVEVIHENDFGNLIIKDAKAQYWRLCPEECYCEVIASTKDELDALFNGKEFLEDWNMTNLVQAARDTCGELPNGKKYALKIPGLLGGEYVTDNLAITPLIELVGLSGDIAKQTHELPAGTSVKLNIID